MKIRLLKLFLQDLYYIWYTGGSSPWGGQIGLATSSDGISDWTKYTSNPVLGPSPGQWDGVWIEGPSIIYENDSLFMRYACYNNLLFRIRLATSEPFDPVSVEQLKPQASDFLLSQNYPNPFNPGTSIQYAVSSRQFVKLTVYDLLGREIENLVNEEKPEGTYEVIWNAANLPSGVYFYKLQAGDFVQTKKMILLR